MKVVILFLLLLLQQYPSDRFSVSLHVLMCSYSGLMSRKFSPLGMDFLLLRKFFVGSSLSLESLCPPFFHPF